MHVGRTGGDVTDAFVRAVFDEVELMLFREGLHLLFTLEHHRNTEAGVGRCHHHPCRIFLEAGRDFELRALTRRDHAFHVADTGGHAQNDRHTELF